jgi:hypothetical protein
VGEATTKMAMLTDVDVDVDVDGDGDTIKRSR